jgi:ribosomal protein S12 methylthiotransferase accessory factor
MSGTTGGDPVIAAGHSGLAGSVAPGSKSVDAPKRYVHGTHRTCAPEDTVARLQPMLREMGITRVANVTGLDRTGIPVVMVCRPNSRSVTVSQGKGLTLAAAKASGIMEALEVWHAERIVKPLTLASFEEMRGEHRVADIAKLSRARASRFTAGLPLLWIEGEDLLSSGRVWVPFELVSTNYTLPLPPGSGCFQANTNGLASGNHWLEAVSHGLCEVVERDATTLWKQRPPGTQDRRVLDPASIDDSACAGVITQLEAADLRVRIWDTTTDVGIASFVCLVMGCDGDDADPEFGAGCHPARHIALLRALTEAAQARNTYIAGARDDYFAHLYSPAWRARRQSACRRLLASAESQRAFAHVPSFEAPTIEADVRWMLARLRAVGVDEVVAVDLTRESIGVPVTRVIVPGLEGIMDEDDGDYAPGPRARQCLQGNA